MRKNEKVTVVTDTNWGDCGKGKITSSLSKDADLVIRANGGINAGHTIVYKGITIALHLIPGGIVYPKATCLIGQGVVVDIPTLFEEISKLEEIGIPNVKERIKISGRAHVVMPYHKELDQLYENMKEHPVGTTKRGIGPAYADKANRIGIRIYDLIGDSKRLTKLFNEAAKAHNPRFVEHNMNSAIIDSAKLSAEYIEYGQRLKSMIVNADQFVETAYSNDKKIVIEGAQAYRLDIDNGDYPNVTSSNCVTFGVLNGAHINPKCPVEVIGCVKAHSSRVGQGPFPTELSAHIENDKVLEYDEPYEGDVIRELAHEYGASTGRPRRVGYFDAVLLKSAKWTLGIDYICINHLDTAGMIGNKLGHIKICTKYVYQGNVIDYYPDDMEITGEIPSPVYETITGGWEFPKGIRNYDELPEKAKQFVELVEKVSGVKVKFIGTGPDNDNLIIRDI